MKNGILFLSGLIVGVVLTFVTVIYILPKKMFVVHESKLNFTETVAAIEESAKVNNWKIPHVYDLQATMEKNGFDVQPVKVFSLCSPEHAYEILSGNKERYASALMPCRVAVYEKQGKTFVSMLNSGLISRLIGGKIKTAMGAAAMENEMILEPIIK